MALNILLILLGLVGLFIGGNWLVKGSARLASSFGVSPLIVGVTVVAFGTSSPELLVNLSAALQGSPDLALGNAIGSNIANIGLVMALAAAIYPIRVHWRMLRLEIPYSLGATIAVLIFAALDGQIGRFDGFLLLMGWVAFNYLIYRVSVEQQEEIEPELLEFEREENLTRSVTRAREIVRLLGGLVALVVGAQLLVTGAIDIARGLNISEAVIGVSMVALGTSLPEVAASVAAALRRESDIAVGNVVGSNVTNMLLIVGLTALISPLPVDPALFRFEFPVLLVFSFVLLTLLIDRRLSRGEAVALLFGYLIFNIFLFAV
ncbi:MAG: calcium/sodium antiporter [Chloroflexi bacterium]|nr:calcium/sodium antiporter [Chloroflexota bacterium]